MPQRANQTSFKKGHKRSPASIEKQRQTLKAKGARPVNPWTEESKAKLRATVRAKSVGNRYIATRHNVDYWQVMTETGRRYEHRVIMEQIVGRPLTPKEHVHHINGNGLDNRPENLELLSGAAEHNKRHPPKKGRPSWRKLPTDQWSEKHVCCVECATTTTAHAARGLCRNCYARTKRPDWPSHQIQHERKKRRRVANP